MVLTRLCFLHIPHDHDTYPNDLMTRLSLILRLFLMHQTMQNAGDITRRYVHRGSELWLDMDLVQRLLCHGMSRFPQWDVLTALKVASTGQYPYLPKRILGYAEFLSPQHMSPPAVRSMVAQRQLMDRLSDVVRMRILAASLPTAFQHISVGMWRKTPRHPFTHLVRSVIACHVINRVCLFVCLFIWVVGS
jgi:hypothetical protein